MARAARTAFSVLGLLAGGTASAWAGAAEPVQSYNSYKSWLAACDNTLSCVAKGFAEDAGTRADLRIERLGGADDALSATLASEAAFALSDLQLDGKPLALEAADWTLTTQDGETSLTSQGPDAVRALVTQLRNGSKLTLGGDAAVPLDGFTAALLRMDERQGRIGGVTALIRGGDAPAASVPAALPVPRIAPHSTGKALSEAETSRLAKGLKASQSRVIEAECQLSDDMLPPSGFELKPGRALVLMPCLLGAYQSSSLAFIVSTKDGTAERLALDAPYQGGSPEETRITLFTEADFAPETGTLSTFAKGRGLADCGMSADWMWTGSGFVLSALSAQYSCGGVQPGDFPILYRSNPA